MKRSEEYLKVLFRTTNRMYVIKSYRESILSIFLSIVNKIRRR